MCLFCRVSNDEQVFLGKKEWGRVRVKEREKKKEKDVQEIKHVQKWVSVKLPKYQRINSSVHSSH